MLAVRRPPTAAAQEQLLDRLFSRVDWGTELVLKQTLGNLLAEREFTQPCDDSSQSVTVDSSSADNPTSLRICLLTAQPDVDRPEDIRHWYQAIGKFPSDAPPDTCRDTPTHTVENLNVESESARGAARLSEPTALDQCNAPLPAKHTASAKQTGDPRPDLSIVIPVFNAEPGLRDAIQSALDGVQRERVQVIVAAAGDVHSSLLVAGELGVECSTLSAGRAQQMNTATRESAGRNVLYLHADTRLPAGYLDRILDVLQDPNTVGGAFRLKIDSSLRRMRIVEQFVTLRCRIFSLPYGDQALFMRRSQYDSLGGFPELPIMEDYALVRRLRRRGKVKLLDASVMTSARRWSRLGVFGTTIVNQVMLIGYHVGISPHRLAQLYRGKPAKK
ncbi:MAG TPA: hypothetical protein DDW52_18615 [Planctomycetaceae bacterium]|nr:hypothetical protein [Planctomycetaceae bacterium]